MRYNPVIGTVENLAGTVRADHTIGALEQHGDERPAKSAGRPGNQYPRSVFNFRGPIGTNEGAFHGSYSFRVSHSVNDFGMRCYRKLATNGIAGSLRVTSVWLAKFPELRLFRCRRNIHVIAGYSSIRVQDDVEKYAAE